VEFEVLGPVRALRGGEAVALGGAMRQALLGLLLARANEPVGVDALVEALWGGEPDERHVPRLHMHVSKLRKALGVPDRLTFDGGTYSLKVLPDELDAHRFDSLLDEATSISRSDPQRCVEVLRKALGLWRGDAYQGLDFADLQGPAQQLSEERMVAYETLMTAELACGRHAQIVAELQELVRAHPFRERLHALLVTALYRGGRQADALAAYRAARQTLVDELGLEPGPELRAIEHQILAGEPVELDGSSRDIATRREVVPAQLPPEGRFFVGRAAELATLDRLADDGGSVMVVSALAGTAGVGKTALAMRWAHRVRDRFDDGQLYVDLRGYGPDDPVAPEDVLAGFLRALGMDGAAIPHEIAERTARFRSMVDGRRMLIVLDNARSVDQVRPLLPGTPTCFVLVTSRDSLAGLVTRDGAHRIDLDQLSDHEAHRLVREILGDHVDVDPGAVAQLVESCARLPLALRIATERIREIGSVVEVVTELADEQARLDLLDAGGDPQTAVRAVFSWSYRQLPPDVARVFRLLGLHPGHDTDAYAVAALADGGLRATQHALEVLLRAHLLDQPAAGRYQPHDLLRVYAAELAATTDSEAERTAAVDRLLDHYLATAALAMTAITPHEAVLRPPLPQAVHETPALTDYAHARRWLETERANLLEATAHGGPRFAIAMSHTVWRHLDISGSHHDAVLLHSRALEAAVSLDDALAEANARRVLSLALNRIGRTQEAIAHLQRALEVYRDQRDPTLHAATLNNLGVVRGKIGELDQAGRDFEKALEINGPTGGRNLYSLVLTNLARNLRSRGRYEEAGVHLEKALAVAVESGYRITESNAQCILADIYARAGRETEAFASARRGLAIAREIGHRMLEGAALRVLGSLYHRGGDHERALHLHTQALTLVQAIGDTELTAETLNAMALTHAAAGRPAEAVRSHEAALAVAQRTAKPVAVVTNYTQLRHDKIAMRLTESGVPVLSPTIDIANARIAFEGGCVANLTASRVSTMRMRKLRLFQRDAYITVDYQARQGAILRRRTGRGGRPEIEVEPVQLGDALLEVPDRALELQDHDVNPRSRSRSPLRASRCTILSTIP
jgi:DNA-binding SARP family transcriptional activator/Tfp pilus assembly protein PilF